MEAINILDKTSFGALSLAISSSDHCVEPFRDWWKLLGQLDQLPPQLGRPVFKALPLNWTTLVRVGSRSLFIR